jgi:hypothetical protein
VTTLDSTAIRDKLVQTMNRYGQTVLGPPLPQRSEAGSVSMRTSTP